MYLEFRLVDLEDGGEPWAVLEDRYVADTSSPFLGIRAERLTSDETGFLLLVARDEATKYVLVDENTRGLIYGDDNPPRTFMLVDDEVTLDIWDKTQKCDNCGWPMSDHKGKNQERCPLPGEPDEDEEEPEK